jgi:hypothetical protein
VGTYIFGDGLVEVGVLLFSDVLGAAGPDGLGLVQQFPVPDGLSDSLGLGLLLFFVLNVLFLLNFNILSVSLLGLLHGDLFLLNRHLLGLSVAGPQVDGEVDELTVLLGDSLRARG